MKNRKPSEFSGVSETPDHTGNVNHTDNRNPEDNGNADSTSPPTPGHEAENPATPPAGRPTVAEYVVGRLAEAGVRNIYAITGDSLNALTDAIARDGRIRFIHMRHEESGAFAAGAEAQLTGRLACCAGSSGPGHIHLINGLYDAQRSGAPVLAIASTCASTMFGTGYFQETDPVLLFSDCSLYNRTAANPSQVPWMLAGAMRHAVAGRGVGVFGLPQDVTTLPVGDSSGTTTVPLSTARLPEPDTDTVARCADILNRAPKVTVFAGSGAAGATEGLRRLAAALNAPVVTTFKSQMELTRDCPNYVGHLGYLGMWSAIDAVSDADAILMVGTDFPFPGFFPSGRHIIQVDVRADRLGKKAPVEIGVRADAGLFFDALLPLLTPRTERSFLDRCLSGFAEIRTRMQEPVTHSGSTGAVRPEFVFATLDRLAADDCVFTVDTGMNCVWASHYLTPSRGRAMIGSFTHGSMANAMPQAIGAVMACPGRQVIALSGDGGLAMLMGDLLTVIQYRLPVKILVADNRSLAYVKWEMELAGYRPGEVSLDNPDFGVLARAMGFESYTVTEPSGLEETMRRWLDCEGPALLSVTTDTDAASFTFSRAMMQGAKPGNLTDNFTPPGS